MKALSRLLLICFLTCPVFADGIVWVETPKNYLGIFADRSTPSSPPREFFSMSTLYLKDKLIVHVGHDLINQNYVVMPSPNIVKIEEINSDSRRVTIQQYFPELEEKILTHYKIPMNNLHFLYLRTYEIYDQDGNLVDKITNPPGIQFRPPQFYSFIVGKKTKMLNFVFGFVGRTGWSNSGLSADIQGIYRDLREIGVDRDSSIKIEIDASTGVKGFEVLTSNENRRVGQILSDFQHIVVWGRMAQKDELISQIIDLKNFEQVHIDLANGVEDLKNYPHIFGDPVNPKFVNAIKKLSVAKLSEKDMSNDKSGSAKLGLFDFFSAEGSGSNKSTSRMKDTVNFDMEGEFYVPKSLNFVVRTNDSFELLKNLVFQAYDDLEESIFLLGTGVSLDEPLPLPPPPVVVTPPAPVPVIKAVPKFIFNYFGDEDVSQCTGGHYGMQTANFGQWTSEIRIDTDHRHGGCLQQFAIYDPDQVLNGLHVYVEFFPDGDGGQCNYPGRREIPIVNSQGLNTANWTVWSTPYRIDADSRAGLSSKDLFISRLEF